MGKVSQRLTFAIGLVIGGSFLWLALRDVNFVNVADSFIDANFWLVFPFLVSLGLFYWLKAVRWAYLLQPTRTLAARDLVPSMMIGFAGNNVLPIRLGELIRVYALGKEQNLAQSTVLGTIILERVFDVVTMLILLTVAIHLTSATSTEFEAARFFMMIAAAIAVLATYFVAVAPPRLTAVLSRLIALLPDRLRHRLQKKLSLLRQGFAAMTQSPGHVLLKLFINSLAQWALLASCIYIAMLAFGIAPSPSIAILILGLVVAGISLPSAPGFVGTIEYCFVLGLGLFGINADLALSIGIYYHAITFLSVTLAGAIALRYLKLTVGNVVRNAPKTK